MVSSKCFGKSDSLIDIFIFTKQVKLILISMFTFVGVLSFVRKHSVHTYDLGLSLIRTHQIFGDKTEEINF